MLQNTCFLRRKGAFIKYVTPLRGMGNLGSVTVYDMEGVSYWMS